MVEKKYILSSLNNALKVLDLLSIKDNLGVAEISKILNIDKTTIFKILYTLHAKDFVFKTTEKKYKLGVKFFNYGNLVSERQSVIEIAKPFMKKLSAQTGQSVFMGILNFNNLVIVLHKEEGDSPNSIKTRIGYELAPHCVAMGKVLLAYLNETQLLSILNEYEFRNYCPNTITTQTTLLTELEKVRKQGYAQDHNERYIGHSASAAPVFNNKGTCIASVSIVYSSELFDQHNDEYNQETLWAGKEISRNLGLAVD